MDIPSVSSFSTLSVLQTSALDARVAQNLPAIEIPGLSGAPRTKSINFSDSELTTFPDKSSFGAEISSIEILDGSRNSIEHIPSWIASFTTLHYLDLSYNKLTFIPPEIGLLKNNLRVFVLRGNFLEECAFPKEFESLKAIEVLNLSGNRLSEIPPQIFGMSRLKHLQLGGNKIISIPPEIGSITNLEVFYLGGNKLKFLPSEIGNLNQLKCLSLSDNLLETIPESLANLRSLRSLALHNNQIRALPQAIIGLNNLEELSLRSNPLIMRFIQNMTHEIPSLLELAGRAMYSHRLNYHHQGLPRHLEQFLDSSHCCVNPKCEGVYFSQRVEHIKFVDFCGKYRVPLMQYLCSPQCQMPSTSALSISGEESASSDNEDLERIVSPAQLRRVLLG